MLPTGAAIEYEWGGSDNGPSGQTYQSPNTNSWSTQDIYGQIFRYVQERRFYPNGGSGAAYTTKITGGLNAETLYRKDAAGNPVAVSTTRHYFYGNPFQHSLDPYYTESWRDGQEYQTEIYRGTGTESSQLLRRTQQTWQPRAYFGWFCQYRSASCGDPNQPGKDARLVETVTTLADTNQVTRQVLGYDQYNNLTDTSEFAYGAGAAGPMVRHSHTDYLTDAAYTSIPANSVGSYLRALPTQTWTAADAAGNNLAARQVFEYDNYATDARHAALFDRTNPSHHDATFGMNYTRRGNVTSLTSYSNAAAQTGAVTVSSQYDVLGNVVQTLDARGYATLLDYTDRFGVPQDNEARSNLPPSQLPPGVQTFAFPTKVTNALNHTAYTQYDYATGLPVNTENPNGAVTATYYQDTLDRPTRMTGPLGTESEIFYHDTPGNLSVRTRTKLDSTRWTESYQYADGLGRTVRAYSQTDTTTQTNSSCAWLGTETRYDTADSNGQPTQWVSNPFCAAEVGAGTGSEWTLSLSDALGRGVEVQTPDSARVLTAYSGNTVTVTDAAGKQRRSVTDALGRLTQVVEDPNGLNYTTAYTYDLLGNLTQVNQGSQVRSFLYDSLSRLRAAQNPEQGTFTAAGDFTGLPAPAAGGGWSLAYLYDANGNLTKRRDARNIETTYTYDALNRNLTTSYSDGVTPTVTRFYDGWRNGVQELTGNVIGQLWRTETANTAVVTYRNFDALGRPLTLEQQFAYQNGSQWNWTAPYQVTRSFDLNLPTGQTYPSQHSVSYSYDAVGRLAGFTGNLGDGVPRAYADTPQYGVRGLQSERYGTLTELYHKMRYNVRGQLWDVQLGTTAALNDPTTSWNRGRLQNLYTADPTASQTTPGNVSATQTTGTDNNGNLRQQNILLPDGTYWQQQYAYDPLNRLKNVEERLNGGSGVLWRQEYEYDRWGNRTINQTHTWGWGVSKPYLAVNETNNRLRVPDGVAGTLAYDGAGNLTYDNYTGSGARTFDAENRMLQAYVGPAVNETVQGWYTYDGDGRRISRTAAGVTTWQVYGFGGELIAEYAAYGASFVPTQEYGYQGGKMLITARNGNAQRLHKFIENLYLRTGQSFTANDVQIRVNALATAGQSSEQDLWGEAKNQARLLLSQYQTTNPTATAFVQALYLSVLQRSGTSGPQGEVAWWASQAQSNPDGVREAFLASGEFTDRVHNLYGTDQSDTQRTDAFAEHLYRSILGRELDASARAWLRNSLDTASAKDLPTTISQAQEWAQTLFSSQEYLNRGRDKHWFVYDLYLTYLGHEPDTLGWQYWAGQVGPNWENKQAVLNAFAGAGPYGEKAGTLYREIFWLVSDHLGTPRLIAERTGSAAGIKRHDYLPFGEELTQGVGGRADWHGYQTLATHDSARQQFTGYERDDETGLDYAKARYYASSTGRFTSPDPLYYTSTRPGDPQQLNLYAYVRNNPLIIIDPDGKEGRVVATSQEALDITKKELKRIAPGTTVDANGKIHKPGFFRRLLNNFTGHGAGTALISRIVDSKNVTVIHATDKKSRPGGTNTDNPILADSVKTNCKCDYLVEFNTKWDGGNPANGSALEVRQKDGSISQEPASLTLALGHELIHADIYNQFGTTFVDVAASHTFSEGNKIYQEIVSAGEFLATGLPFTSNGSGGVPSSVDVTENKLRKELMKEPKLRASYRPRNTWEQIQ